MSGSSSSLFVAIPTIWINTRRLCLMNMFLHNIGEMDGEREALVKQVFQRITIDGKDFVDIEPKPEYAPLFATMLPAQKVGYQELESPPSPPKAQ